MADALVCSIMMTLWSVSRQADTSQYHRVNVLLIVCNTQYFYVLAGNADRIFSIKYEEEVASLLIYEWARTQKYCVGLLKSVYYLLYYYYN